MIKVFYRDEQTAPNAESFSPSAGKPAKAVESWYASDFPIEVSSFEPLTATEIALAHDPAMVRAVLACEAPNGFSNRSPEVAASLPYTSGSMAAAALYALQTGRVAVSPTSGFHHAGFNGPSAFCTFNGLMIAAQMCLANGAAKVGIIDCDAHYGNGTDNIIRHLGLQDKVQHWTLGRTRTHITAQNAERWLSVFPKIVEKFKGCDVLLYQAGADPHIEDPLGGTLTSEQMRLRDRIVFTVAHALKIPVAWNLAGGYQNPLRKVLDLHDATMEECVSTYLTSSDKLIFNQENI